MTTRRLNKILKHKHECRSNQYTSSGLPGEEDLQGVAVQSDASWKFLFLLCIIL